MIDLDRLDSEERRLWDRTFPGGFCAEGPDNEGAEFRLWSYGEICMFELGRVPDVVTEALPTNPTIGEMVQEYMRRRSEADLQERVAETGLSTEELRAAYDGPPPIPVEALRGELIREFGPDEGVTIEHAEHLCTDEHGVPRLIPVTVVRLPNGTSVQFFPKQPLGGPRREDFGRGRKGDAE